MVSPTTKSPRAARADATRNRARILDAARAAFADPDAEISMAEIARRSGVGSATLYRNFASRHQLLEALYVNEVDAICRAADRIEGDSASDRFMGWLDEFFVYLTSKRHVATGLLEHTNRSDAVFGTSRDRVITAATPLLQAAQSAGEIRRDLSLDQILDMIAAIAKIHRDASYIQPILQAALDGLRIPRQQ